MCGYTLSCCLGIVFYVKIIDNTYGIKYNKFCLEKINFGFSVLRTRKPKVYYCETEEKGEGKNGDWHSDKSAQAQE